MLNICLLEELARSVSIGNLAVQVWKRVCKGLEGSYELFVGSPPLLGFGNALLNLVDECRVLDRALVFLRVGEGLGGFGVRSLSLRAKSSRPSGLFGSSLTIKSLVRNYTSLALFGLTYHRGLSWIESIR